MKAARCMNWWPVVRKGGLPERRSLMVRAWSANRRVSGMWEVSAFSSYASICGDLLISCGPRFSPYGDTVNLSRCFYSPAILTLCVNPQVGGLLSCSHSKPPRDSRASLKVDAKSLCQFFAEYSICFAFSNKGLVIKRSSNAAGCGDPTVIASSGPRCGKGPSNPHEQARACYPALC